MILNFIDIDEIANADKIGNKAKSLCELKKNGFNVPDGFVIDSDTYTEFIKSNKINKKISEKLKKLDKNNISNTSKYILKLFDNTSFSQDIEKQILGSLDDNKKYAVRSSGTKEDMDNYSFAGQYKTFLDTDKNSVIEKVIECYKSMFSEVILSYISNNSIDISNYGMSVVVQEMCDAQYSGICFTCNPISRNR